MVDQTAPLRIGIIVDSLVQPRWVRRSLERVLASGVAIIELVVRVELNPERPSLLRRLYDRIDRRLFAAEAMEPVSVEDLLGPVPIGDGVLDSNLDLLINFADCDLNAEFADAAKHGVWFYSFGAAPGFEELSNGAPIIHTALRSRKGNTEAVVYESVTPALSRFSVRVNNNTSFWKAAAFVSRALKDLHAERGLEGNGDQSPPARAPGNTAMTQLFLKLSGRAAARAFDRSSSFEQWVIAYQIGAGEFRYLVPPADRFWADPFPLKVNGKYYIFFEDYVNEIGRAHISVVEVNNEGIVDGPIEVLKLDCHLSYPFVFEWQDDYWMIPETGERNVVELYRCVSFPSVWEPEKVLLETNHPLDATVVEAGGVWWMFVNVEEDGVAVNWDELHLYYADNLLGEWRPHARNPIVSDVRSARPAGRLFWSNDELYRPSQDSSLRYGYATTINKVISLSPRTYHEEEVGKLLPDWDGQVIGVHTLNFLDDFTVIDCLTKRKRRAEARFKSPRHSLDLLSSANIELRSATVSNLVSRIKS